MEQLHDYGDDRQRDWCVYCGGPTQSRDHVPSRVLLDEPYPDQLPVVPACQKCNEGFSKDEAYLACLIECAVTGGVDACGRDKVQRIFATAPGLVQRLRESKHEVDGTPHHAIESDRVVNVVLKLARGHIAYEQNEPQLDDPSRVEFVPLSVLSEDQRGAFETGECAESATEMWPDVGSRLAFRVVEGHDMGCHGWIVVQEARYRYRVTGHHVSLVIGEYLAAEIIWE